EVSRARSCLQAALHAATEVGSPSLLLEVLVTLAELPVLSGDSARVHRAAQVLLSHPLASHSTRQRAAALLPHPPPPPAPAAPRPVLSLLVREVLSAVGMA
ncbi:MAG TPA: hypothetical protein VK458_03490, partial [Myxococcaceae bacterium]|nr:hypothetical protein [Myxococcaceae bacterium]